MTDFCELTPFGNTVPQYLASMVRIQNNLNALGIKYDDKQVIGTALTKLRKYPEHSAWHKLYNDLSFKFKDSPKQLDMLYFERFVHQTNRDIEFQEKQKESDGTGEESVQDDAVFAAKALKAGNQDTGTKTATTPNSTPVTPAEKQNNPKYDGKRKGRDRESRGGNNRANAVKAHDNDDSDAQCYIQSTVLALFDHSNLLRKSEAYLDSGSSRHINSDPRLFADATNVTRHPSQVIVGNGERVTAEAKGDVPVALVIGDARFNIILENCLLVPRIRTKLVSVSQLTENGYDVRFDRSCATVSRNGGSELVLQKIDKLYPMQLSPVSSAEKVFVTSDELWHMRLGHMADRTLKHACIPGHQHGSVNHCEACARGKSKKSSFPRSESESADILELLHVDLAGSFTNSIKGGKYFMVIVYDRSRYYEVYILKHKSEALGFMERFSQLHETRTGKRVNCIRSDNGGEFLKDEWDQWLSSKGIRRELTSPYSAAQNGRAERAIGVLKTGATTLLQQARLPRKFWSSAVRTFAYVRNKVPLSSKPEHIPEAIFYHRQIEYENLRVFGCVAWHHIPKERRKAMDAKAEKCIFIGPLRPRGHDAGTKGGESRRAKDVVEFATDEDVSGERNQDEPEIEQASEEPRVEVIPAHVPRERRPPRHLQEYQVYAVNGEHQESLEEIMDRGSAMAFHTRRDEDYKEAEAKEIQSIHDHNVWDLVPNEGQRLIGRRFLHPEKIDADGDVLKKARLIVHGNTQRPGEDYAISEIFAPVVKLESLRILLAYAVIEALYDDLVAAGSDDVLAELRRHLDAELNMKWTHQPRLLLGLELDHDHSKGSLRLSQTRYIDEVLADYDLSNCTPTKTPIYEQFPFDHECQKKPDRRFPYLESIGKLNWIARGTRPDIAFAVSHLARFCSSYQLEHWNACLHLLKYLKGTRQAYLEYHQQESTVPFGYSDADWTQNKGDRKSVTGFIFNMAGAPITWSSKGQATIALSSTEAEYVALSATTREALWLTYPSVTAASLACVSPPRIHDSNLHLAAWQTHGFVLPKPLRVGRLLNDTAELTGRETHCWVPSCEALVCGRLER
ncbi:hypothetical protein NCC49_004374 [Naganishia albida]|nr:hypothetical protein NCC49_004374 [Naganishia albida]